MYNTERQAQQTAATTGANLLQNRAATFQNLSQAPFTQAANLSQGSPGRYGMLGGGLQHALPEGAIENVMRGAYGVSANLHGGQSALQAAAQAIEGIRPGATQTPQGQAALATYMQMQELIQQKLKVGQVKAPPAATPGGGTVTSGQPAPVPAPAVAAPVTQPDMGVQPQPGMSPAAGATQALGDPYGRMMNFSAPVTAPTPTINIQLLMVED